MKRNKILALCLLGIMILSSCGGGNSSKGGVSSPSLIPSTSSSTKVEPSNSTSSPIAGSSSTSSTLSNSSSDKYVPTPMPNPDKNIYLIGASVWGWSNYAKLTLMTDNIFYGTFDLKSSAEGFVITDQQNYNGLVFHDENNKNFTVAKYGTYNVYFTYDETKIDDTWKTAIEKSNTVVAYYKFELESSVEIPIDEKMMFINGPAVEGWGTYIPLFEDEETGIYSYIYGLKANGEGFTITNAEDNLNEVYHKEDGSNITVSHAGDYLIMFTYNNMSNDDTWTLVKDANNKEGYYKLEALFDIPVTPEPDPDPNPNPDPDPDPDPDPTLGQLYMFGGALGSWENAIVLPEVEEGIYKTEINISASNEGFVICELDVLSNKEGFCLHDEEGNNFQVAHTGLYELSVTWNDMSQDEAWKVAKEVNENAKGDGYYKLIPLFEINENPENPVIETLFVNGGNVGGWSSYVQLTKTPEGLFEGKVTLAVSTDGFVITAQQNRNNDGVVFKPTDGVNFNIEKAGNYIISFSFEEQDENWIEVADAKGNYTGTCYVKLEEVVETRINLMQSGTVSVKVSSTNDDVKTADKVYDGQSADLNRWESQQGVDPQWIEIDLGAEHTINGLDIQWYGAASAKTYTIEISTDGVEWTVLEDVTNTNGSRNRLDTYTFTNATARYIKINGTSRVATYGYSIGEIYVWGV